ncbi:MAG: hypothetical protein NT141_00360 [candidate division WWE3 bacterium]|nr:hypothetical protein [candidate division WWE3 bacterium]
MEDQAITAALERRWPAAVELNQEILKANSEDVEALCRLGRAYIELTKIPKAVETFKKVLKIDPLHPVAQRNLDQLKSGIVTTSYRGSETAGNFLIEPGTTKKITAHLDSQKINPRKIVSGQVFTLKINADQVIVQDKNDRAIGCVSSDIADFVNAKKVFGVKEMTATFLGVERQTFVEMLARSPKPIFRAEKQGINPEARFQVGDETTEE